MDIKSYTKEDVEEMYHILSTVFNFYLEEHSSCSPTSITVFDLVKFLLSNLSAKEE